MKKVFIFYKEEIILYRKSKNYYIVKCEYKDEAGRVYDAVMIPDKYIKQIVVPGRDTKVAKWDKQIIYEMTIKRKTTKFFLMESHDSPMGKYYKDPQPPIAVPYHEINFNQTPAKKIVADMGVSKYIKS